MCMFYLLINPQSIYIFPMFAAVLMMVKKPRRWYCYSTLWYYCTISIPNNTMELGCDYLAVFSRFLLITPLHTTAGQHCTGLGRGNLKSTRILPASLPTVSALHTSYSIFNYQLSLIFKLHNISFQLGNCQIKTSELESHRYLLGRTGSLLEYKYVICMLRKR